MKFQVIPLKLFSQWPERNLKTKKVLYNMKEHSFQLHFGKLVRQITFQHSHIIETLRHCITFGDAFILSNLHSAGIRDVILKFILLYSLLWNQLCVRWTYKIENVIYYSQPRNIFQYFWLTGYYSWKYNWCFSNYQPQISWKPLAATLQLWMFSICML